MWSFFNIFFLKLFPISSLIKIIIQINAIIRYIHIQLQPFITDFDYYIFLNNSFIIKFKFFMIFY